MSNLLLEVPESLAEGFKEEHHKDTVIRAKISGAVAMALVSLDVLYNAVHIRTSGLWEIYPAWQNIVYINLGWFCFGGTILFGAAAWYRKTRINPVFFHAIFLFAIFINMSGIQNSGLSTYAVICVAVALLTLENFKTATLFYTCITVIFLFLIHFFTTDPVLRAQFFADTVVIGVIGLALNRHMYFTYVRTFLDRKTIEQQRQKLELELKHRNSLEEQVIRSEKMASLGVLSAGIAHEINNPLMIIQGNLELMQDAITENRISDIQTRTQYLIRAVNRIATIVKGLGSYARTDSTENVTLNLHDVIQESLAIISPLYSKSGISIQTAFNSKKPQIKGNSGHLQQVLMNLFSNARDALTFVKGERLIHVTTKDEDDGILLLIEDTGSGIPPETLQKIFDPFFTTKPPGSGTGLGLSISLSIIHSFGGKISAHSTPGFGTTMKISIPHFQANTLEPNHPKMGVPSPMTAKSQKSILLVNDEKEVRDVVVEMLKNFKGEIQTARDGREAFELIQKNKFDIVITDLQMPQIDGETLIIEANRHNPTAKTRFVILTGNLLVDQQIMLHQKLKRIPYQILEKPFTRDELWKVLSRETAEV